MIEPIHLDVACPSCDTELIYSSRSDRQSGRGHCPECGKVTAVTAVEKAPAPKRPEEHAVRLPSASTVRDWAASTGPRELWAVALLGAAAGLLAAAWWRKR
jgi:uncharacterized Zn finger protein (UPF0148 family)